MEETRLGVIIMGLFEVFAMVAAVYALGENKRYAVLAAAIAGSAILIWVKITFYQEGTTLLNPALDLLVAVLYALTFFAVFARVLSRGIVTSEKLQGAICGYLLIAFCWSQLFALVEHFEPGSFPVSQAYDMDGVLDINDLLYFSFATLTSTGYGEIVAVTSEARSLAILEQIIGVFYVAVIIARLAGVYPAEDKESM